MDMVKRLRGLHRLGALRELWAGHVICTEVGTEAIRWMRSPRVKKVVKEGGRA